MDVWPGGAESLGNEVRPQERSLGCHRASEEGQKRKGESEATKASLKEGISEPMVPEVENTAQGLSRGRGV